MYITTFYSFKGGVGRTMALINVGFELARRGRKVLLVDFDLEAPGITTYEAFSQAASSPGVVDYINDYIDTNIAPDVDQYISRCTMSIEGEALPIWFMPSGRQDKHYASKLTSIDWQELYEEHSGYLMFEDLKQQWARHASKFDYVLIDSRTGHTDVGGICTRQLPNAVVLMFFPNEQNVSGLKAVASAIRRENRAREADIGLLFCASNVPNLDDEHQILSKHLQSAKETLRFAEAAAVIRRYDSLALLDQTVFSVARPKTRLSEEYRKLTTAVVKLNIEDREGAVATLNEIRRQFQRRSADDAGETRSAADPFLSRVSKQMGEIQLHHPHDGEIAWRLAMIFHQLGEISQEANALSISINEGYNQEESLFRRAMCRLSQQEPEGAKADLRALLAAENASAVNISASLEILRDIDPNWLEAVQESHGIEHLAFEDQIQIGRVLGSHRDGLVLNLARYDRIIAETDSDVARWLARSERDLSLIGLGRFSEAQASITQALGLVGSSRRLPLLFNLAMADWGMNGRPSLQLFERVAEAAAETKPFMGSNYSQCMAIVSYVRNDRDGALAHLARVTQQPHAWRCLSVVGDTSMQPSRR